MLRMGGPRVWSNCAVYLLVEISDKYFQPVLVREYEMTEPVTIFFFLTGAQTCSQRTCLIYVCNATNTYACLLCDMYYSKCRGYGSKQRRQSGYPCAVCILLEETKKAIKHNMELHIKL